MINRFVKDIYIKFKISPSIEFKASNIDAHTKKIIAEKTLDFLIKNTDFQLGAITVKKEKVMAHIRTDGNKLYNYMIGQSILPKILTSPSISLIRDMRSVKVESGKSCHEYLQIRLWFDFGTPTVITDLPTFSHTNKCLIFIDWITNFVWSYYEDGANVPFEILAPKLLNQTLFF